MNIKPLHDRVVIKRMEEEKMSAGGIVIPDSATEKPIKGNVIAVGDGKALDNGTVRAPKVKVGDQVSNEDELMILEALKMENPIFAPADGRITAIKVEPGAAVESNQLLLVIE